MKVFSYITRSELITEFNPSNEAGTATFSVWSTDGKDCLLKFSDAVPATFEQIDDRAELEGLIAWRNNH